MEAPGRARIEMAVWTCFLLLCALCTVLTSTDKRVFHSQSEANTLFQRSRRSNSFLLEEILQGSLERECVEETCSYEEAREYFEDTPKTDAFWAMYTDGDHCKPNPCLNGANCTDKLGGYSCACKEFYEGVNCEKDVSQCHSEGPLSCDHFCRPNYRSYQCSCAEGYRLHTDGRTCLPEALHACGRAPAPKLGERNQVDPNSNSASQLCRHSGCPWQVMLLDGAGRELCSGVILGQRSILTAAACVSKSQSLLVALREPAAEAGLQEQVWPDEEEPRPSRIWTQVTPVTEISVHKRYRTGEPGDDLAFLQVHRLIRFDMGVYQTCVPEKDFSENVLMEAGQEGWVGGSGAELGGPHRLAYQPLEQCQSRLNLSFPLTNKMFCMAGWVGGGGCGLLPGTPVVSVRRHSAFLTGLVTSAQTHNCSQGHVFTKLSRYLPWIRQQLQLSEK